MGIAAGLKYEDVTHDHPCHSCHKPCASGFVTYCDIDTGLVKRVICRDCYTKELYADYIKSGNITTRLWTDATITLMDAHDFGVRGINRPTRDRWRDVCDINDAMVRVAYAAKFFEKSVWFGRCAYFPPLQIISQKSSMKGMSAKNKFKTPYGDAKFLVYTMAGRAMITLETDKASVTLITDESSSESRMGVQGICATGDQACEIIMAAIETWKANEIEIEEDREVGMGF